MNINNREILTSAPATLASLRVAATWLKQPFNLPLLALALDNGFKPVFKKERQKFTGAEAREVICMAACLIRAPGMSAHWDEISPGARSLRDLSACLELLADLVPSSDNVIFSPPWLEYP